MLSRYLIGPLYGSQHGETLLRVHSITIFIIRVMLTRALRTLVKNPVKESFYGKKKKKLMF